MKWKAVACLAMALAWAGVAGAANEPAGQSAGKPPARPMSRGGALAAALGLAPVAAPAPRPLADTIENRTVVALWDGDWDEVERLYAQARMDTQRSREGSYAACLFARGVTRKRAGEELADFEAKVAKTRDWVRRRPESALAPAIHVEALLDLAWFYRGSGYANTVSEQRFEEFRAKLEEAFAYTSSHLDVMEKESFYTRPLLTLLRGLNVDAQRQMEVARRAMRKEPGDECIYLRVVESLLPKWGGSPEQLEAWVRESMRGLPEAAALMRYARLYDNAASSGYQQALFRSSLARWPLMRDGLRQILIESPDSRYWKNRLAYFSCMAQDRDIAIPALEAIEAEPDFNAWGSAGQRTYEACRRWSLQS